MSLLHLLKVPFGTEEIKSFLLRNFAIQIKASIILTKKKTLKLNFSSELIVLFNMVSLSSIRFFFIFLFNLGSGLHSTGVLTRVLSIKFHHQISKIKIRNFFRVWKELLFHLDYEVRISLIDAAKRILLRVI